MTSSKQIKLWFAIGSMVTATLHSHASESSDVSHDTNAHPDLPVITVTAPRLSRSLYDTPAAASVIDERSIQVGQQAVQLDESLVTIPGLFLQNRTNYAQGQRIASRGFGARAPFGIRGIHIRVDGIPYTLPDGQAQIDAVDLDSARHIEVLRGPSSVLYGNAAGGVLDVTTEDGTRRSDLASLTVQTGSDNFRKISASAGNRVGDWSYNVSLSALDFDGYRDQSAVEKRLLNTRLGYQIDGSRRVSMLVNILDLPVAEDPGGLTRAEVEANPRQAAPLAAALQSGQSVEQQTLGLFYQDADMGGGELNLHGFTSWRRFEQQLPFPGSSLVGYDRAYYGAGVDYGFDMQAAGKPIRVLTGTEVRRQEDDRSRNSVNINQEVTGVTGDEMQTATSTGVFVLADVGLSDRLAMSAGIRHDWVRLEIADRLASSVDASGDKTFTEWSGSLGISYRFLQSHQLYGNISNSFETPTFTEFARPDGEPGFNVQLEPQKAFSRELGVRGYLGGIHYDLSAFWVDVDNELLPFEAWDGRTYYENAGETSRQGLELEIDWALDHAWTLTSAVTFASYRFDRFETADATYNGLRIPGLPTQQWNNRLRWTGMGGRFFDIEGLYTGGFYADNANDVDVESDWVASLRAGNSWFVSRNLILNTYVGVRDVFDNEGFSNIRINANGGRYYEPAPGRTFYAGISVSL